MNVHMCHMNQIIAVNNSKIFSRIFGFYLFIQLADNRNQLWNNVFQIMDWPFFKRLSQNCMIGICTYIGNDFSSFIKVNSTLTKKADELRNDHTWVSVIDLNNSIISQIMKVASLGNCLIQNQLSGIADHEILLVNTKLTSIFITVIRIQEQCQIVENILFVKGNSIMNHGLICQINVKKVKVDCFVFIACNINTIHCRFQGKTSERNHISYVCSSQPGIRSDPWIRYFMLKIVFKNLFEKSEMVIQTNTFSRKSKCCNRIQKTCSQTSKTTISKRWFWLNGLNFCKRFAIFFQKFCNLIVDSKIDQIVGKKLTNEKFGRNIVNFFLAIVIAFCS